MSTAEVVVRTALVSSSVALAVLGLLVGYTRLRKGWLNHNLKLLMLALHTNGPQTVAQLSEAGLGRSKMIREVLEYGIDEGFIRSANLALITHSKYTFRQYMLSMKGQDYAYFWARDKYWRDKEQKKCS